MRIPVRPAMFIALAVVVVLTLGASGLAAEPTASYAPGMVLVRFRAGAEAAAVERLLARTGLRVQRTIPRVRVLCVQIPQSANVPAVVRQLARESIVEFAEPNYIRHALFIPNDPMFGSQWDMLKMRLPGAWNVTRGSASVVVAVVDTGIDLQHPDLVGSLWRNADEIANNSRDDDHNGYVDDVNGYDFAGNGIFPLEPAEDPIPNDTLDHGSHVSGTVAAQQNNGIGVTGMAPLTKIMAVKVLGGLLGAGYSSDIAAGIIYATDNGARVINMSLGGTGLSLLEYNAVKYAWDHNVFMAAAAGNSGDSDNPIEYPAAYPFPMSVGATDRSDNLAYFSSHNGLVEVSAPGVDILSTVPGGGYEQADWSGTSMATPHISGLAALLIALHPTLANWQIRAMIQDGCFDRGSAGWDPFYGYGRADAALAGSLPVPPASVLRLLTPSNGATYPGSALVAAVWNPVTGAASYRLKATLPNQSVRTIPVNATYYTVHPDTPMANGTFTVTVEALNGANAVIGSDTVSFQRTN